MLYGGQALPLVEGMRIVKRSDLSKFYKINTMEIPIKIKNESELNRIRKILKGEKITVINSQRKRKKIERPNKETLDVFAKTDKGISLVKCKDVDDFFKKLGI